MSIFVTTTPQQKKLAKTVAALRGIPLQDLINELLMEEARRVLTPDQLVSILQNGDSTDTHVPEDTPHPKRSAAQR